MFLERLIQHVRADKWAELAVIDKRYDALEARYGFPPKRRYQALFGKLDANTLVIEREWESLTKMEAIFGACMADPEFQQLQAEIISIVDSNIQEMYWVR